MKHFKSTHQPTFPVSTHEINMGVSIVMIMFICSLSFFYTLPIQAQNSTSITAGLVIGTNALQTPTLTISNTSFAPGENTVFTLNPVVLANSQVVVGATCTFTFSLAGGSTVIIQSVTNSSGGCSFNTANTLASQGFTLVSGTLADVNNLAGVHSAKVDITSLVGSAATAPVQYTITAPQLVPPQFNIVEQEITTGTGINVVMAPAVLNDGTVVSNAPATLVIQTPSGGQIILNGITKADGTFTFSSSQSLASQNLTLVSGNISALDNSTGQYQGYVEITWSGGKTKTNFDQYLVQSPQNIVRTGGIVAIPLVIIGFVIVFIVNSKSQKKMKADK